MESSLLFMPPIIWRKNRKARRLGLRVDAVKRAVVVTLPPGANRQHGMAFLQTQAGWLERALQTLPPRAMESGRIWLEGREILLVFNTVHKRACLDHGKLYLPTHEPEKHLITFLRIQAERILPPIVAEHSVHMGVVPRKLSLRNVKSRWGSCTHKGGVMLNWRLVMAPDFVSHYVIVHELAHLVHFNHGPDFWRLVDEYTPENSTQKTNKNETGRKKAEKWLKEYGTHLLCCV